MIVTGLYLYGSNMILKLDCVGLDTYGLEEVLYWFYYYLVTQTWEWRWPLSKREGEVKTAEPPASWAEERGEAPVGRWLRGRGRCQVPLPVPDSLWFWWVISISLSQFFPNKMARREGYVTMAHELVFYKWAGRYASSWGLPTLACTPSQAVDTYVHACIHISVRLCIMCMYEHMHPHTSSGALPAQTTKSLKKKAFKRIIWWVPLHPNKNIPHSKKMTRLPFPKISVREVDSLPLMMYLIF